MYMKQSPYQLHPQQFLSSSSSFYIMLHMCILWCVSNFFAYERKLTLRNMNGILYCCYQNSPYQLCPHILVFMFKNYIPHRQTDTHIHTCARARTHTHTRTHNVHYYKNVSIILMFTYENKKYTRSSKLTMYIVGWITIK